MATQQVLVSTKGRKHSVVLEKYFYFSMSLLISAVVVYGFSHTVNQNLIHAAPPRPWILWVHGIVFSGWLAFFVFQSALVRTHSVKVHRTMGWFGVGLASVMTVLGLSTAIIMDRFNSLHFHLPDAYTFFSIQLWDITSFTTFFWLAVYWRRKPELHRRLVLIATCMLTSAAFGRFPQIPIGWFYGGVDALILLGVVRDLIVNRKVHVIYRYALPLLITGQILAVRVWLHHPSWWVKVTDAIVG